MLHGFESNSRRLKSVHDIDVRKQIIVRIKNLKIQTFLNAVG